MLLATVSLVFVSALAAQSTPDRKQNATPAEDLLRTLRHLRPANEVIPPGSTTDSSMTPSTATDHALLLPEGSTWVDQSGQLERDADWWVFRPTSGDSATAARLLPNANLESMVRSLRGVNSGARFTISGELTVFERRGYVIVRSATRGPVAVAELSKATPEPPRPATTASAGTVLERMQALEPKDALMTPGESPAGTASVSVGGRLLLDGTAVVRRVGRLTRQEGWWVFASDSDHADSVDAPVRLLPNQALEMMVKDSQAGGASGYTLSGEATLFLGENYLLPRVATRRVDLGNLRK